MSHKNRSLANSRYEAKRIYMQRKEINRLKDEIERQCKSQVVLDDEITNLYDRIHKVCDLIDIYLEGINLEAFDCLCLLQKIKEFLVG